MTLKDLEWPFYVKLLRTALSEFYFYILIVEPIYKYFFIFTRDQQRYAEADRDLQNIWDPQKDCGSFVDKKLRTLHRRNPNE